MEGSAGVVKESWARSIKIKELQEELDRVTKESWEMLKVQRIEEAYDLKNRQEELDIEIAELKAAEAKAKEKARKAKAAAAAQAGILALPSKDDQLRVLQEELEQAHALDDLQRSVQVRQEIRALQDDPARSSSGAAGSGAPLALTMDPAQLSTADIDPREVQGLKVEVPMPKKRTGEFALRGRAAERFTRMQEELQEATQSGDQERAARLRLRLENFKTQYMDFDPRKDALTRSIEAGTESAQPAAQPIGVLVATEHEAQPRRTGRQAKGKGRGKGKGRDRAARDRAAGDPPTADFTPPPRVDAQANAKAGTLQAGPVARGEGLTEDQRKARKQVQAWREEMELLELGLQDLAGDMECRQAVELKQRQGELTEKMELFEQAALEGGPALAAALRTLDHTDPRAAQLAALAKLGSSSPAR